MRRPFQIIFVASGKLFLFLHIAASYIIRQRSLLKTQSSFLSGVYVL
jgi:hypothetical protein